MYDAGESLALGPAAAIAPAANAAVEPRGIAGCEELHPRIYAWMLGVYLAILALLTLAFATAAEASSWLAIDIAFFAVFFTMPVVLHRLARQPSDPMVSFAEFRTRGIETWTGRLPWNEAATQVLLVPVALASAVAAIGLVAVLAR
jgi:hypothetical protein